MSREPNASKSGLPDDESNENANHPPQIDSVPGGKSQPLPPEPELPSATKYSQEETMGCTSAKSTEPKSKSTDLKQTKTTDHMPKKSTNSPPGPAAKKMKKDRDPTPPRDYNQDFTDDEDDQNKAPPRQTVGPVTRSTTALSKLSIDFEDSDSEDNNVSRWAKRDIDEYRAGYPDLRQNSKQNTNLRFYMNEMPSHPDGDLIDSIHEKWRGNYRKLEFHHGFIQWLFPLQEAGLNWSADPLQKHEIEKIKESKKAMERILKSYELMLDFYGFKLESRETGELVRTENYRDRFDNLNTSSHNYLRITRILKCLGEFDYEHLKYPFLRAILYEAIIENTIPRCLRSCRDYWIETLKDQNERREIRKFARDLLKYRQDNIRPPKSFLALQRPTPTAKAAKKSPVKHHRQSSDT